MPKKTTKVAEEKPVAAELVADKPVKAAKPAIKPVGPGDKKKASAIKKFQTHATDTGSTDVQVAVLTEKINQLSQHLTEHKKDNDSRSGLLKMISHRRSLLTYLDKRHPDQYKKVIAQLGLRK